MPSLQMPVFRLNKDTPFPISVIGISFNWSGFYIWRNFGAFSCSYVLMLFVISAYIRPRYVGPQQKRQYNGHMELWLVNKSLGSLGVEVRQASWYVSLLSSSEFVVFHAIEHELGSSYLTFLLSKSLLWRIREHKRFITRIVVKCKQIFHLVHICLKANWSADV